MRRGPLYRVIKWAGFTVGGYVAAVVPWSLSHEPSMTSVVLLVAGLVATAALGIVLVPFAMISVCRTFINRYARPSQATDGPEADYGEPDPPSS